MAVAAAKASSAGLISGAPMMRTYSALGILKNATERPHPKIAFVTPEQYQTITSYPWNQNADSASFYTLLHENEHSGDFAEGEKADYKKITDDVENWIQKITLWCMNQNRLTVLAMTSSRAIADWVYCGAIS